MPLTENDQLTFNSTLDTLADTLRITKLDQRSKDEYFKSLRNLTPNQFFAAVGYVRNTYRRKYKDDFPPPAVILEAVEESAQKIPEVKTWECRCCKVPFPAGAFTAMKCGCDTEYCFRCEGCTEHCACPEGMQSFEESEVCQEIRRIVKGAPEWSIVLQSKKGVSLKTPQT